MRQQKGFTLIELMIVVAIIGILAAVALPAYRDYTVRAQVSEGLSLSGDIQVSIDDFYKHKGHLPTTSASAGLSLATSYFGNYVSQIAYDPTNGVVVTYGIEAHDDLTTSTLQLHAMSNAAGSLIWVCGLNTTIQTKVASAGGAAETTYSAALTTVENQFLPTTCRP